MLLLPLLFVFPACAQSAGKPIAARLPQTLEFRNIVAHPHDSKAFTQGLVFFDGMLYESTGHYGQSSVRQVEIATGNVLQRKDVPREFFAEGLERIGDTFYLLTWREKRCFLLDRQTLERSGEFSYDGEGWGLCFDGESLILSDGTAILRFYDPKTFRLTGKKTVFDGSSVRRGRLVTMLNELEFVHGEIWANVWKETRIARINPKTGKVIGWIDLSAFVPQGLDPRGEHVLNGIAFDAATNRVFVTGKNWPVVYEMTIVTKDEKTP